MDRNLQKWHIDFIIEKYEFNSAKKVVEMFEEEFRTKISKSTVWHYGKPKRNTFSYWKHWQLQYLEENYNPKRVEGIAKFLGKSVESVKSKHAELMRLKKKQEVELKQSPERVFKEIDLNVGDYKHFKMKTNDYNHRFDAFKGEVVSETDRFYVVKTEFGFIECLSKAGIFIGEIQFKEA